MSLLDGWRFCPRCAGHLTPANDRTTCAACGFVAWANSVPGVQALIVDGDRVLLGLRGSEPGTGRWDIPGGFLHEGEDPLDGLRREVLEETGYRIEPLEFFGAWTEPYEGRLVLALTWTARIVGGEPRAGDDLVALRWFSRDELPAPNALAFVTFPEILERWRASAS